MQALRTRILMMKSPITRSISTNNGCLREIFKIQSVDDFKQKVDIGSKDKVVIVDFFATWCGPCKMLTPRIETIMGENEGKVNLAKVDIDEHTEIALDYDVSSVPVLVAIRNGKIQDRVVGLQDTDKLRTWVAKQVAKS
ncbi:thioredoxin, mitochondrial-like [Culicoides brevitarsis]|uniref:thioredoxin, mitochondrial-like n=1 Tax=Culicoides brevitarsis TaxID=469753 RepID=UPI00307BE7FE